MSEWLLILFLSAGAHGYSHEIMSVEGEDKCHTLGRMWEKKMTIVLNPDSYWNRAVVRRATYECIQLK